MLGCTRPAPVERSKVVKEAIEVRYDSLGGDYDPRFAAVAAAGASEQEGERGERGGAKPRERRRGTRKLAS